MKYVYGMKSLPFYPNYMPRTGVTIKQHFDPNDEYGEVIVLSREASEKEIDWYRLDYITKLEESND